MVVLLSDGRVERLRSDGWPRRTKSRRGSLAGRPRRRGRLSDGRLRLAGDANGWKGVGDSSMDVLIVYGEGERCRNECVCVSVLECVQNNIRDPIY